MYYLKHFLLALIPGIIIGLGWFSLVQKTGVLDGNIPKDIKAYVITSGSMEPAVPVGSVVITQQTETYKIGDIVTFNLSNKKDHHVTHRIVGHKGAELITKGDANEEADQGTIQQKQISGKILITLPYIGHIVNMAKTPQGFVALIVIPATIIIYEELKVLLKELKSIFEKIAKRAGNRGATIRPYWRGAVVLPVVGFTFVLTSLSSSYFSDLENSLNNVLGVATTYGTSPTSTPVPTQPPVTKIVINEVYYDPNDDHIIGNQSENNFEWIELYNPSKTETVNIKNWTITDATGGDETIVDANLYIEPQSFLVIGKAATIATQWSLNPDNFHPMGKTIGAGLNNPGDAVILKDDSGVIIDQMSYGNDSSVFNPGTNPIGEGHSLERDPDGQDTDTAADFIDRSTPTPGS